MQLRVCIETEKGGGWGWECERRTIGCALARICLTRHHALGHAIQLLHAVVSGHSVPAAQNIEKIVLGGLSRDVRGLVKIGYAQLVERW